MKNRKFWNFVPPEGEQEPELHIDGEIIMEQGMLEKIFGIEQQTALDIEKELQKYESQNITVWINSPGGEVIAASKIYTALKNHKGKVTVKIDGSAISAASVIAMAGDEVWMSPTSIMMIHNPATYAEGEVKDFEKVITLLQEAKETIMNAYQLKTGKSREELSELMNLEKWMSPQEAKKLGFCDGILFTEGEGEYSEKIMNGILQNAKRLADCAGKFGTTFEAINNVITNTNAKKTTEEAIDEFASAMLEIEKLRM